MGTLGKYDKQTDDFQKKDHEENIWSYKWILEDPN
jgi:hypothetical protein